MRNIRIKEWESFSVQDERFFLTAYLGNLKLYQVVQVILYDKEAGIKYSFRRIIPGNTWKLPRNLSNASVECRNSRFFFRIHPWLIADTVKLDFDVAATKKHPAITAHLSYKMGSRDVTPIAVSLNFTDSRSMYAFKALAAVSGDIVLGGRHASLDPARSIGFFRDYKGFFPYGMSEFLCSAMGFDQDGRRYGFHIVENLAKDARKNNENALWVNGKLTLLPPVHITMPNGPESNWVIQDIDGMVDLVFTPREMSRHGTNFPVIGGDFFASMGYYNGMLASAREEQIQLRNQWGMGEKIYLRM
jgi:hypothetical protein